MNSTVQKGLLAVGVLVMAAALLVVAIVVAIPVMALSITFVLWRPANDPRTTELIVGDESRKMRKLF